MKFTILFISILFSMACKESSSLKQQVSANQANGVSSAANDIPTGGVQENRANVTLKQGTSSATSKDQNHTEEKQIIVKTANISVLTANFSESESRIKNLIKQFGILVHDQKLVSEYDSKRGNYVLRVEAEKLEPVVDSLTQLGVGCTQIEVKSEDMTSEFVDLELRLKTKHTVYEQYLALLRQAKTVDDILKVQESARVLREEIESLEGRIQYLGNHSQFSTINFNLIERDNEVVKAETGFGYKMKNQFKLGLQWSENFLLFLIAIWPALLVGIPSIIFRTKIKGLFNKGIN